MTRRWRLLCLPLACASLSAEPQQPQRAVRAAEAPASSLAWQRPTKSGTFFDVVGRRAAIFGYEQRPMEVWIYPFKVIDELTFSFELDGYPLPIPSADLPATIEVRPEATIFVWSHAAFTVRAVLLAPIDEPGVVISLDIDSVLPLTVHGAFRPRLRPMWPAGASTTDASWNTERSSYELSAESGRFAAVITVPGGHDRSIMPYQAEPRDVPLQFVVPSPAGAPARRIVTFVISAAADGRDAARASAARLAGRTDEAYRETAAHYARLLETTIGVTTPDARVNRAFEWARVGVDKGVATNPMLGTGLLAGFRTSGNSERPGFAWFFGRDALWTTLALISSGDFATTREALAFLAKYQRSDGKIPHEISQSATLVPWFTDYPYAWASADATPLFVIAHADYWRASGDRAFLDAQWESVRKAYGFSAGTDRDGNGLIENTGVGHGWVEGGALYPPHEELYLQALWIEASRSLAELAEVLGRSSDTTGARANAARAQSAMEATYWLADRGMYAFATAQPRATPAVAEPGPARQRRQRRLDAMKDARIVDEDTVMPAVPMWWRLLEPARAEQQIDRLGGGALAADWGHRILSDRSELYDPLSYHYGSVWPLFTGWASLGAYRYGRPHVGYQGLMATALLTETSALGYVTELLSGDFNQAFGRSSHHQVWSEAMVITPLVRGLLGIEASGGARTLRIAPQLPADWDRVAIRNVAAGSTRHDVLLQRGSGRLTVQVDRQPSAGTGAPVSLHLAPALPLDARVGTVSINGRSAPFRVERAGDVQFIEIAVEQPAERTTAAIAYQGGSDVYLAVPDLVPGARSRGLRVLRSRAEPQALRVLVEGLGGERYELGLRTPRRVANVNGARLETRAGRDPVLIVESGDPAGEYVRREIVVTFVP